MLESAGGIDAQLMGPGGVRAAVVGPDNQTARADLTDQYPAGNRIAERIDAIRHANVVRSSVELNRLTSSDRRGNARRKLRAVVLGIYPLA